MPTSRNTHREASDSPAFHGASFRCKNESKPQDAHEPPRSSRHREDKAHAFYRTPETHDESVSVNPVPSVHADFDPFTFHKPDKLRTRELRPLVRVEDPQLSYLKSAVKCLQIKAFSQHRREFPGQNIPALPIHDRYRVDKLLGQPDVCYFRAPGLIWSVNRASMDKDKPSSPNRS